MDVFQHIFYGLGVALQPPNLLFCFIGVLIGTLVGVLPGLGPVAAISLLLPATFRASPVASIIMLSTVPPLAAGETMTLGFAINEFPLMPGSYQMEIHVKDTSRAKYEVLPQSFRFDVAETPVYGGRKMDHWFGLVALNAAPLHERPRS